MKKISTLEAVCPFCQKPNGYAVLTLAEEHIITKDIKRAITDIPCKKCGKFLDKGDIGFITDNGTAIIISKNEALKILNKFSSNKLFKKSKRNIFKVPFKFWEVIKK